MTKPPKDQPAKARREKPAAHVFTLRGRPVGFRASQFGGEVVAVERGYFPVSSTGYRSLSSSFRVPDEQQIAAVSLEFLEKLATDEDKERHGLLKRVSRMPEPGRDGLIGYIGASMDAEKAMSDGFFAPDHERPALWGGAYRLFCLIDSDRRFQPQPDGNRWSAEHCAKAVTQARTLRALVERLAKGDFPATVPAPQRFFCGHSYFDLPPKPQGETPFALPTVSKEFVFDTPSAPRPAAAPRGEREPRPVVPETDPPAPSVQMSLF